MQKKKITKENNTAIIVINYRVTNLLPLKLVCHLL